MHDNQENDVVIQEPALQHLSRKTSCLKKTCLNACGCLVLVLIASFIFLRLIASPNEKTIKTIPDEVKSQIPLYDEAGLNKITFAPGSEKQKKLGLIAFFPKLIISPFVVYFPERFLEKDSFASTSSKKDILYSFMEAPIGEAKDSYTFEWQNLGAEPDFIYNFYKNELETKNYTIGYDQTTALVHQLLFSSTSTLGTIRIEDEKDKKSGTDQVIMNISIVHTTDK